MDATLLGAARRVAIAIVLASTGAASAHAAMATGGLTSQPSGHFEFCKSNPAECSIRMRDEGPAAMTATLWREVNSVNVSVNRSIRPMNDFDIYGSDEVWAYPDSRKRRGRRHRRRAPRRPARSDP